MRCVVFDGFSSVAQLLLDGIMYGSREVSVPFCDDEFVLGSSRASGPTMSPHVGAPLDESWSKCPSGVSACFLVAVQASWMFNILSVL